MSTKATIAKKNRARGKRNEKVLEKCLGGERKGIFGGEDISMEIWSVEAKSRKKFVGRGFMEQAVRNCPKGKTPLVVVHIVGQRRYNDLVMMRMGDFEDYLGRVEEKEDD